MSVKITKAPANGEYVVTKDGAAIGTVRKRVEHYNLRRAVTVTSWIAYRGDGRKISRDFRTRRDAVAALEDRTCVACDLAASRCRAIYEKSDLTCCRRCDHGEAQ